jgi:hypothetical protein
VICRPGVIKDFSHPAGRGTVPQDLLIQWTTGAQRAAIALMWDTQAAETDARVQNDGRLSFQ